MATLFIKCHKNAASIPAIVAAFAAHGLRLEIQQVRVPLYYAGLLKNKPRNFAFVHSVSPAQTAAMVALGRITFEGAVFLISEARPRIPARFSNQEMPLVLNQQRETKIVPKGQRTKSFEESDFRG